MNKGFIGPVGDDIPSIMIIVMALGLFFTGVVFALDVYNEKVEGINYLTAAVDIGRVVAGHGTVSNLGEASEDALFVSRSYGIKYDVSFEDEDEPQIYSAGKDVTDEEGVCDRRAYVFNYLVSYGIEADELKILRIRVCK